MFAENIMTNVIMLLGCYNIYFLGDDIEKGHCSLPAEIPTDPSASLGATGRNLLRMSFRDIGSR